MEGFDQNAIKVPHWYVVQVSDTTMLHIAASLLGQCFTTYTKSGDGYKR